MVQFDTRASGGDDDSSSDDTNTDTGTSSNTDSSSSGSNDGGGGGDQGSSRAAEAASAARQRAVEAASGVKRRAPTGGEAAASTAERINADVGVDKRKTSRNKEFVKSVQSTAEMAAPTRHSLKTMDQSSRVSAMARAGLDSQAARLASAEPGVDSQATGLDVRPGFTSGETGTQRGGDSGGASRPGGTAGVDTGGIRDTINQNSGGDINAGSSDGGQPETPTGGGPEVARPGSNDGMSLSVALEQGQNQGSDRPATSGTGSNGTTGDAGGTGAGLSEEQRQQAIGGFILNNWDIVDTGAGDDTGWLSRDEITVRRNDAGTWVVGPSEQALRQRRQASARSRVNSLLDEDGRGSGLEQAIQREIETARQQAIPQLGTTETPGLANTRVPGAAVSTPVAADRQTAQNLQGAAQRYSELVQNERAMAEMGGQFSDEQLNYRAQEANVQSEDREGFGFGTDIGRRIDSALGNTDEQVNQFTRGVRSFQLQNILNEREFAERGISGEDIQETGWDVADALYKDITGQATLYEQMRPEDSEMVLKTGPGPLGVVSRGGANVPSYLRALRGSRAAAAVEGGSTAGRVAASGGSAGTGVVSRTATSVDDALKLAGLATAAGAASMERDSELDVGEQNQDVTEVEVPEEDQPTEVEAGPMNEPELAPESTLPTAVSELDIAAREATNPTTIRTSELVQPEERSDFGKETPDEVLVDEELDYIRVGDEIVLIGDRPTEFYEERGFPTGESAVVGRETAEQDVAEGAEDVAEPGEQIGVDVGTETGETPLAGDRSEQPFGADRFDQGPGALERPAQAGRTDLGFSQDFGAETELMSESLLNTGQVAQTTMEAGTRERLEFQHDTVTENEVATEFELGSKTESESQIRGDRQPDRPWEREFGFSSGGRSSSGEQGLGAGWFNEFVTAYALGAGPREVASTGGDSGAIALTEQRQTQAQARGSEEIAAVAAGFSFEGLGEDLTGGGNSKSGGDESWLSL